MNKSLTTLTIKDFEVFAYHGVKEEEKKLGGKFQIDISLSYDATDATLQDELSVALNYEEILYSVNEVITNENYNLIETLTLEIINTIMDKYNFIDKITVKVRKFNIPYKANIGYVEAEQTFERIHN